MLIRSFEVSLEREERAVTTQRNLRADVCRPFLDDSAKVKRRKISWLAAERVKDKTASRLK
jgi:hypothetical protein